MELVGAEFPNNIRVDPNQDPNYQDQNPINRVLTFWARAELAADREHYDAGNLHYLFPYKNLALYGPKPPNTDELDPREQDDKQDFQKQNIAAFDFTDAWVARGYASAGGWDGPFVKLSYDGGPLSVLARAASARGIALGREIRAWIRIGPNQTASPIRVPYNPRTDRYEIEIWSYPQGDLRGLLGERGRRAMDDGVLVADPTLVRGDRAAFEGAEFSNLRGQSNLGLAQTNNPAPVDIVLRQPDHAMHPVLPLRVEVAWATPDLALWDSKDGANYAYEFAMLHRGWRRYLQVGMSRHPHGGVGFLEYRNLLSNYFGLEGRRQTALGERWAPELGREVNPWNFDANAWDGTRAAGPKPAATKLERFLAVDYMDLHLLSPKCGIGIHRHRDNQEIFLLMKGSAVMVVGDWAKMTGRERAFEVRMLEPGDLTICKTGQLHALYNHTDEQIQLFMFGGYD
jgi:mannose-6-phosphate isomerase-like protein (cupin superfamily)